MNETVVLRGARVVTASGVLDPGAVQLTGERITGLRPDRGADLPGSSIDLEGRWLLPGFVDEHVHGGGGGDFGAPDPQVHAQALQFHAEHGTTSLLPTTASAQPQPLLDIVSALRATLGAPPPGARPFGLHLEGPWLAEEKRGAHATEDLRTPDTAELDRLQRTAEGAIRLVTVAPELPHAIDFIRHACRGGVQVNVGHTGASYEQVVAAVGAGATALTHTYNAMSPLQHREPGAVGAAMTLDGLLCELILDFVHVAPPAAKALFRTTGVERLILITDAVTAAGLPDGSYSFGERDIDVRDGTVRLPGTDTLAGSGLTLDVALRNSVETLGIDLVDASALLSGNVARRFDLASQLGTIAEGLLADLVVLDDHLGVVATLVGGQVVAGAEHLEGLQP